MDAVKTGAQKHAPKHMRAVRASRKSFMLFVTSIPYLWPPALAPSCLLSAPSRPSGARPVFRACRAARALTWGTHDFCWLAMHTDVRRGCCQCWRTPIANLLRTLDGNLHVRQTHLCRTGEGQEVSERHNSCAVRSTRCLCSEACMAWPRLSSHKKKTQQLCPLPYR